MLAQIISNIKIDSVYYKMTLDCSNVSCQCQPGQFTMLKVGSGYDPLLRRPFGIHRIKEVRSGNRKKVVLEILYKVVGKGTLMMSQMKTGNEVDIMGPLGNGFEINDGLETAILVAGGIGVAPLLALADELVSQDKAKKIIIFIGGKTGDDVLCIKDFAELEVEVKAATEDGSLGYKGFITDLFAEVFSNRWLLTGAKNQIFCCGPMAMMSKIAQIALESEVSCQVSLDKRMACGVGACLGCAVKVWETKNNQQQANRDYIYKKVCKDGPVFDAREIIW